MNTPVDPINIDGIDYKYADLTEEQQHLVQQVVAIDDALNKMAWQREHAKAARETYFIRLNSAMEKEDGEAKEGRVQENPDA